MAGTRTLIPVSYTDNARGIYLKNYADMAVYGNEGGGTLYAIRFGGYPEQAEALAAAIYGGGSVELEIGKSTVTLRTITKQYVKKVSHDGVYAEVTMYAQEIPETVPQQQKQEQQEHDQEQEDTSTENVSDMSPPRGVCIYTAPGDAAALYDAIDKAVSVPLIPEFADWLIAELVRRGDLKPLQVLTVSAKPDAWILRCAGGEKNIIAAVEDGLKSGSISITGASPPHAPKDLTPAGDISDVKTVTEYLTRFGPAIAERIKKLFVPLFAPEHDELSPEVLAVNGSIREKAGYPLYDAQLAVAEAIKRRLSTHKSGIVIAECGSGKTKIGLAAIAAAAAGLAADQRKRCKTKTFNIVICPAHITEKWVREINESLSDTFAGIVSSIAGFDRLYSDYAKGGKSCYAVISKENARDGYMRAPAVLWNKLKGSFVCPDCGGTVMMEIYEGKTRYEVPADQFFFKQENKQNHKCENCGSPLWTALNPHIAHKWAKIGGYGFVYAPKAPEHMGKVKNPLFEEKLLGIMSRTHKTAGAHRKYPLSTYIRKKYRGRIDGLIVDELHDYTNDSGQGDAMAELYGAAKKVIGMTATLINGYASGIFHLLYRLVPGLMEKDGQDHGAPNDFAKQYGVIRNVYIQDEGSYNSNRRTAKRKKSTKQLPGVSPLVYTRFLLEYAAFLTLNDMGKDLPEYDEIPIALELPQDIKNTCDSMRDVLVKYMKHDKKAANRILSAYLNLLIAYPDQPYGQPQILDPFTGQVIVDPPDMGSIETLMPKDRAILDMAERKIKAGENILIYTNWTRLDTQRKLHKLLTGAGYRAEILPARVPPKKRERWVNGKLGEGVRILIANPALVQTGLDLNAFTTLIFYDTGYKLFTLRQAMRRSYRINQTAPRIEVYLLYYIDTMQHKGMKLMGTKLAVASIIEGGFSEEGLAAMSQCDDMTTLMAKELMLGIRDNVEDVSAAFRRMSAMRQTQGATPGQREAAELVSFGDIGACESKPAVRLVEFAFAETIDPVQANPPTSQKKYKSIAPDGQLSIFDMLGLSA